MATKPSTLFDLLLSFSVKLLVSKNFGLIDSVFLKVLLDCMKQRTHTSLKCVKGYMRQRTDVALYRSACTSLWSTTLSVKVSFSILWRGCASHNEQGSLPKCSSFKAKIQWNFLTVLEFEDWANLLVLLLYFILWLWGLWTCGIIRIFFG